MGCGRHANSRATWLSHHLLLSKFTLIFLGIIEQFDFDWTQQSEIVCVFWRRHFGFSIY